MFATFTRRGSNALKFIIYNSIYYIKSMMNKILFLNLKALFEKENVILKLNSQTIFFGTKTTNLNNFANLANKSHLL